MSNILLGRKMKNETVLLCKKKKFPLFGKKNEKQQFIIKIYNKCDVYSPSRVLNFAITNENWNFIFYIDSCLGKLKKKKKEKTTTCDLFQKWWLFVIGVVFCFCYLH